MTTLRTQGVAGRLAMIRTWLKAIWRRRFPKPRVVPAAKPDYFTERDWRVIVDNEHPDDLAYYYLAESPFVRKGQASARDPSNTC